MVFNQETINLIMKEPIILAAIFLPLAILLLFSILPKGSSNKPKKNLVNLSLKKDQTKVVDAYDCNEIEKLAEYKDGKLVMCRCWRSKKFPYCDGSHVEHNKETGDNVGPLIIKK